ncbi:MAG: helicase-related protein, partial [Bacteroidota bacterium]
TEDKFKSAMEVVKSIRGSGIIYVRSRNKTKEIAYALRKNQVSADYYHAGLDTDVRSRKQEAWVNNKIRIIVATNAFGMGIDKPDVRYVIHMDMPDTLEEYFQEAGRAGRDEKKAFAVLLYNESDAVKARQRLMNNFPEPKLVKQVYQALGNYFQIPEGAGKDMSFDFNLMDFSSTYKLSSYQVHSSLKILEREGYLGLSDEINNPSRLIFLVNRDELYSYQLKNAKLDTFIKLLLRSYTGLFSEYVKVDEVWLAKQAGVTIDVIFQYLNKLSGQGIINYIPKKKTPVIFMMEERLPVKNLHIAKENFMERKKIYENRLNKVLAYAGTSNRCRSQLLLDYFGQQNVPLCGQCDVCRKRAVQGLSSDEILAIETAIRTALTNNSLLLDTLVDSLDTKKENTLEIIRWMIDDGHLIHTDEGKIKLKS